MDEGDGAWEMKMAHYVPGQEPLRNQTDTMTPS